MKPIDIGHKRPIDGDAVYRVSYTVISPPITEVFLFQNGKDIKRNAKGVSAEEIVAQIGADAFVLVERDGSEPECRIASKKWFRRSDIIEVLPFEDGAQVMLRPLADYCNPIMRGVRFGGWSVETLKGKLGLADQ